MHDHRIDAARGSGNRNVLVINVENIAAFLDDLRSTLARDASLASTVSRIIPVSDHFSFSAPEEFKRKARDVVAKWVPEIVGKRFYVRMQRRGFKGWLSRYDEEQFLGRFVLERAVVAGVEAVVDFDDPYIVIVVETLGQQAATLQRAGINVLSGRPDEDFERIAAQVAAAICRSTDSRISHENRRMLIVRVPEDRGCLANSSSSGPMRASAC